MTLLLCLPLTDKCLRVISLLKEMAVEISISGNCVTEFYRPAVILKYKSVMLAFLAFSSCRAVQLHSMLAQPTCQGPLPPQHCTEIIASLSLLHASLDSLLAWGTCMVPTSVAGRQAAMEAGVEDGDMDLNEEDEYDSTPMLVIQDIIAADSGPDVGNIMKYLAGSSGGCGESVSVSVSVLLSEVLLPLIFEIGRAYSSRSIEAADSKAAFGYSLSDLCASCGCALSSLLQGLLRPLSPAFYIAEHSACLKAAGSDSLSVQRLSELKRLCLVNTAIVSGVAAYWEALLGVSLRALLGMAAQWGLAGTQAGGAAGGSGFLAEAHARLLSNEFCYNLLWGDRYSTGVSSEPSFGVSSPLLISLVELTVFVCEKQSVRAVLCYAMLCYVMPCCAMLCHAVLCYAMLCYVMPCYAMLCHAMLWYAMLCYIMLSYTILCYAMCSFKHPPHFYNYTPLYIYYSFSLLCRLYSSDLRLSSLKHGEPWARNASPLWPAAWAVPALT
jgi:hypothetical protein